MGDPRVSGSSSVYTPQQPPTTDDQMLDILNNPRMNENAKVAELEKSVEHLPESEKAALYERLKDKKSHDPVARQFHYRLSHHPSKPGKLSTVDQVLNTLKPASPKTAAPAQETKNNASTKGASPSVIDPKTADALAKDHFLNPDGAKAAPPIDPSVLPSGESISAKVWIDDDITKPRVETTYDFSRPLNRNQAAAILFQDGKVPDGADLKQGSDNKWIVSTTHGVESRSSVAAHQNSHIEQEVVRNRSPKEYFFPTPERTFTWTGGPHQSASIRKDLKNDYGFTVTKRYPLDEGKLPDMNVRRMVAKGPGFELKFDKPMTSDQVMDKLFNKDELKERQVRLVPQSKEPSQTWEVQLLDGGVALTKEAGNAFGASNTYAKESFPPGFPAGIQSHIENHTVPKNATKFPPNAYVWEQEGNLVRVETNGKTGAAGYYKYETTELAKNDPKGNATMRWLMLEKGLPVRQAWEQYITHYDQLHAGMLSMVGGAGRFIPHASGTAMPTRSSFGERAIRAGGRAGEAEVGPEIVSSGQGGAHPEAAPSVAEPAISGRGPSDTHISNPPPMPEPQASGNSNAKPGAAQTQSKYPFTIEHKAPPAPWKPNVPAPKEKTPTNVSSPPPAPKGAPKPSSPEPASGGSGQKTFGHGVDTENIVPGAAPLKNISGGKGKTLPGSLTRKVGRTPKQAPPELIGIPKESGQPLSAEQVLVANRTNSNKIGWSMTAKEHMAQWKAANPKSTEPPPVAFTASHGRIQVSEEAWVASGQPVLWGLATE